MIKLVILAASLGLDNLSVGVSIGLGRIRLLEALRISLAFGIAQAFFPGAGILLGTYLGTRIGHVASFVGYGLLIVLGLYTAWVGLAQEEKKDHAGVLSGRMGILMTASAVSIDSLAVGLSLGFTGGSLWLAVILLGASAFVMTFMGILFGARIGEHFGPLGEIIAGAVLALTGAGLLLQKLMELKIV